MEMDSPRGRIYQVLQVHDGQMQIGDSFALHIDRCLGCLACETACPSGVQYGRIVERASKSEIFKHPQHPYTQALLDTIPPLTGARPKRLMVIPGMPPSLLNRIDGCAFAPRCPYRFPTPPVHA